MQPITKISLKCDISVWMEPNYTYQRMYLWSHREATMCLGLNWFCAIHQYLGNGDTWRIIRFNYQFQSIPTKIRCMSEAKIFSTPTSSAHTDIYTHTWWLTSHYKICIRQMNILIVSVSIVAISTRTKVTDRRRNDNNNSNDKKDRCTNNYNKPAMSMITAIAAKAKPIAIIKIETTMVNKKTKNKKQNNCIKQNHSYQNNDNQNNIPSVTIGRIVIFMT